MARRAMFLRCRIWIVYALLFALAVPWYWRFVPLDKDTLLLGMPVWATAAVFGSLAISVYTWWLLQRPWPEEGRPWPEEGRPWPEEGQESAEGDSA